MKSDKIRDIVREYSKNLKNVNNIGKFGLNVK